MLISFETPTSFHGLKSADKIHCRFSIEEVREAMRVGVGRLDESDTKHPEYKEGNLRLPPSTAIANRLIEAVLTGFAGNLTPNL